MKILGFNFTKISAEKKPKFKSQDRNINIEFLDINKEELELLKSEDALKVDFKFLVEYFNAKDKKEGNQGEINLFGTLTLTSEENEVKEVLKAWKKKALPNNFKLFLFNFILNKCSVKALSLEEDLNLPHHVPMPRINPERK